MPSPKIFGISVPTWSGIFSECHHAPYAQIFWNVFRLGKAVFQGGTMTPKPKIFGISVSTW